MEVYITKYALTNGIEKTEARQVTETLIDAGTGVGWYEKPHWYTSKTEAIAQAEKMKAAKIKSLQKQLDKLNELMFEYGK